MTLSGAIGSFAGPLLRGLDFGAKLVATSVLGGLASVAGGGKFANGAVTAAFGYLFNEMGTHRERNRLIADGSQSEIDQINDALNRLCMNSESACKLIDALRNGPEDVKIRLTDGVNQYNARWNTVYYNPDSDVFKTEAWKGIPPEIALGHELIHAFHDVNGMLPQGGFDPKGREEWNTVGLPTFWDWARGRSPTGYGPFTENKIRKDYGVRLRQSY